VICVLVCLFSIQYAIAQVGIGTTNPDVTSILDIQSSNKGLLIPRMTKTERDNIITPALALQIYNTTDNTSIYLVAVFEILYFNPSSNLVYVYSLADLPAPVAAGITLNANKMYIFLAL
jgi:hypothetical protein